MKNNNQTIAKINTVKAVFSCVPMERHRKVMSADYFPSVD